jgi:hypothetical protein
LCGFPQNSSESFVRIDSLAVLSKERNPEIKSPSQGELMMDQSATEEKIYECEIRILKKNLATGENYYGWKIVPVREAIENKIASDDVRCKACHGRVKLLNQYGNIGNAPHAVHYSRQDSNYCPLGFYFRQAKDGREPRLSGMQVD